MEKKKHSSAKLPSLQEIVSNENSRTAHNDLQVLLNQDPPAHWVQVNPHAGNTRYLPIDKIEYMLTRIFTAWRVEVLGYSLLANSCTAHVRLYYRCPITGAELWQDGLGAAPIQVNAGASATDTGAMKAHGVQMALPAAETFAIKDAAEKIGRLFGRDLKRRDLRNYAELLGRYAPPPVDRIAKMIVSAKTLDDLAKCRKVAKPEHDDLIAQREKEITR